MVDYQRLQYAARLVPISELAIGYLNVNEALLAPLINGTTSDPYTLDTASVMSALATVGAPSAVVDAFASFLGVLAYRYTLLDTVELPPGVDPAVLDAIVQARLAVVASGLDARIDSLEAFEIGVDPDGNKKINASKQESEPFLKPTPALVWTFTHNFGRDPVPVVKDLLGKVITPNEVLYPDNNTITIRFAVPQAGSAELT